MTPRPEDRLIVALDVPGEPEAAAFVAELTGVVSFYKVGYQLFLAAGMPFVRRLVEQGKRVFLDLKMNDVPETIALAIRQMAGAGVEFTTIYGTSATARAAVAGRAGAAVPKLLQVTLLTSMDDALDQGLAGGDPRASGSGGVEEYVLSRGEQAIGAGCDGLIAAGSSVASLRRRLGPDPIIVCPGIRLAGTSAQDHRRVATPREAIQAGADFLVVGRPIRDAPAPRSAAQAIVSEIEEGLGARG